MLADAVDSVHAGAVVSNEDERLSLRVEAEETPTSGHLRLIDRAGNEVGHMRFRREGKKLIVIVHTEVDSSLRGQQGGRRIFERMVEWARKTGTRVRSECPFTNAMFARTPSARDVLAE
jgi:predicted GNAT family acetyltransferase